MKVLAFLLRKSKLALILAALAGVVSGVSNTGLLALINASLGLETAPRMTLLWAFAGLCVLVPLTRIAAELLLTHLGQRTIYELRMEMCRRVLAVPLRHLEQLGAPRILATLTGDIPAITGVVTLLPVLSINLAILVGGLAYLGWLSWKVLLLVLGFIVLGIASYQLPIVRAFRHFNEARKRQDDLFGHFRALTEGAKELKLHFRRRQSFFDEDLDHTASAVRRLNVRGQSIYTVASSWGQLLVFVVIGLLLFVIPSLGIADPALKTLTGYTLVLLYLMTPLQELMNSIPGLSQAEVALRRVQEIGLDLADNATETGPEVLPPLTGDWHRLELQGVVHVYRREGEDEDFVLGPIDLALERGELLFIAGGNGSGKTTLAKILTGLYAPDRGEIRLDDEAVTDANREAYRQRFSAVFSDFYLFARLLGLDSPQLGERVTELLTRLQLDHKVEIRDGELSTTDLSQGQRKRLALLTAYLEDRPIYLFDEWAADQDPYFREIFYLQLLPELKSRGKTVVVISHDDRYYHVGDRVIKLEYGKVVKEMAPASAAPVAL